MSKAKLNMLLLSLSGIIAGVCVNFSEYLGFLGWLALCPAAFVLFGMAKGGVRLLRFYRAGLLFFLCYFLFAWHFFCYMYPLDFTGIDNFTSVIVIAVAWLGLSTLQALIASLSFLLFGLCFKLRLMSKMDWLMPLVLSACYTVLEWFSTVGWWGVPWARLSLSQINYLPIMQTASLFGSYFITALLVFVSGALAFAFMKGRAALSVSRLFSALALLVFVLNFALGGLLYSLEVNAEEKEEKVTVAAIQGNFSSKDINPEITYTEMLDVYELYTRRAALAGAKLAVWPETSLPYYLIEGGKIEARISRIAKENNIAIIFGALGLEDIDTYNCAFYAHCDGEMDTTVYKKRHLVPFGEYMPMRGFLDAILPFMEDINLFPDDMVAGDKSEIFTVEGVGPVGGLICFDSIYEELSRRSVIDGAELFALGTNDSWFSDSVAAYLHHSHARLRSIEFRRYTVRSAVTGVSSVIAPSGELLDRTELLCEDYAIADISARTDRTLYSYIGNLFVYLSLGALALPFVLEGAVRIYQRRKSNEDNT